MKIGYFKSYDNTQHFYRSWNYKKGQKTIIIMHRGHEHSGRLQEFAENELFSDYNIFSYDQRGLGLTEEKVSPVFMDYVRDLDCYVRFLADEYKVHSSDTFIVANSIAGIIVTGWLHDFAPKIAGVALLAPAFGINLYVPFAKEAVSLAIAISPNFEVPSYVKSKMLTHDVKQQESYDSDKLITRSINGALLVDMLNHGKRIVSDAAVIDTPTLILSAEKDYVVMNKLQKQFFVNIDTYTKEFRVIKGAYHGLIFETMRDEVYRSIADFVKYCFAIPSKDDNLDPDKFTLNEYHEMSLKMMPLLEKVNFGVQRLLLPQVGKMSKGMSIGLKYGFDSGISLDYVYRNVAQGQMGIGKIMDKNYLNSTGWKGIRQRKVNLLNLIESEIERLKTIGESVRILDIAGGTGNYLFDIKDKYPDIDVVINDFTKSNIDFGMKIISEKGLDNIRFTNCDCFDHEFYKELNFRPNIVIISGIFELFGSNQDVNSAVSGVASIIDNEGVVIYTGQPWHPQLKMIAHVLNSHRGVDWIMRRRSQKELDKIFNLNNLEKCNMLIDNSGIFTVSCARKIKE